VLQAGVALRFGVCTLPTAPWDELVRRWRALDELGLESIWVPDQLIPRPGLHWFEAWTMLGALAEVTERARIGPLVSPIVLRNPGVLAKAAVTLDHASGGRAELGVGAGGHSLDHEQAGVERWPATERDRRLRAFVERVQELWDDPDLAPPPVQERVPLTVGGISAPTLRLAAEHAARWCSYGGYSAKPDEAAAHAFGHNELLDRFCEQQGRDPASLRRSILLGYLYVQETPWRSDEDFHLVVERWRAAGMDEIIWVYPPQAAMPAGTVTEGVFERMMEG
jgi:alkanesulfonate monooxygenase SsuD/methylene tetrahydromethanopterin reductase-like flavin-dependent oxidoreductase (luciferase family)